jgi:hypothetical protein
MEFGRRRHKQFTWYKFCSQGRGLGISGGEANPVKFIENMGSQAEFEKHLLFCRLACHLLFLAVSA